MDLDANYLKANFKAKTVLKRFKLKQKCKVIKLFLSYEKVLDLHSKDIHSIKESSFKSFPILRSLYLHNNLITKLTRNALTGLRSLTILDVSFNKISEIDKYALGPLKKLEILKLNDNQLSDLTCLKESTNLLLLHLNNNLIQSINNNEFQELTNLIELKLSYNQIKNLESDVFSNLINLKVLDLDGNQLNGIRLNGPSSLTTLILSYNEITTIDINSFNGLFNLEKLDLNSNKITRIVDDSFNDLKNLKDLNLSGNGINCVGVNTFKGLTNLVDLNLFHNHLETISKSLFKQNVKLVNLNLSYNKIKQISSDSFSNLIYLKRLNLSSNFLEELNSKLFSNQINLNELSILNNQIVELKSNQFKGLYALRSLCLSYNQIRSIKSNAFENLFSLEHLYLNNNSLKSFNCNLLTSLTNLVKLDLSNNQINSLIESFTNPELQILDLHNNSISGLNENAFKSAPKLNSLYLHPVKFVLNSSVLVALNLENLTLFDEFVIKNAKFDRENLEINKQNLQLFSNSEFSNQILNSTYKLNRNSLVSIELNEKPYKCLQPGFKWTNLDTKFSAIIGANGIGKTTLLDLIKDTINQNDSSYYVSNYFNTLQSNVYTLKYLNKRIDSLDRDNFASNLYDIINLFSLVQYLDYLILSNHKISDFKLDESLFKYKFSKKRLELRQKEQQVYLKNEAKQGLKYYSSIKTIEYYLGLSREFRLSPGECLILLIQLWRVHARKLKLKNKNKPIQNKLRILLLDEPDAHMHPKLIKDFISLISNNELDYLNLQIVMTTHNPVTVSFIPIQNLFELKRSPSNQNLTISKIENRSQLINKASDNLFYIKEKFKIVLIEGSLGDDEAFYNLVYSIAIKENSKTPVKFQEMGSKQFNQIFRLDTSKDLDYSIDEFIFGINDGDYFIQDAYDHFEIDKIVPNEYQFNFKRLKRYSIENYIFDPINLLFAINCLLNKFDKTLNKTNTNSFHDKYVDFLDLIRQYENVNDFIVSNSNSVAILNELLRETNEFYLEKIKQDKSADDFNANFQLNKFQSDKLKKEIPIRFIISETSEVSLNYYPSILYFKGKILAVYLSEFLNSFYSATNTKNLSLDNFIDQQYDYFDPISCYFSFKRYAHYFKSMNDIANSRNLKDLINKICELDRDQNLKLSESLNEYLSKSTDFNIVNEILSEIAIKTQNKLLTSKCFFSFLRENKVDSIYKIELNQISLIHDYFTSCTRYKKLSNKLDFKHDPVVKYFEDEILQSSSSDACLNTHYEKLVSDIEIRAEFDKLGIKSRNQKSIKLTSSEDDWKLKINKWLLEKYKTNLRIVKRVKTFNFKNKDIRLEYLELFDIKSNKNALSELYSKGLVLETRKKCFINAFKTSGLLIDSHLFEIMKMINYSVP